MPRDDSNDAAIIACGQKVIRTEGDAVTKMAEELGESFAAAVRVMLDAKGRIIVTGMGKSGLIARKIAATMASTGTPSMFVHPADASHGDLGMITREDVVLMLSNSGETPELADLIAYTRAHKIPLIGVASVATSTLMVKSDHAIVLPRAPEACPNGLAPTTSTTVTLALGDALAVAMMEQRSFTPENFRDFHPGGKLGAILSTVGDLMHGPDGLPLVGIDAPMSDALIEISARGFGVVGVVGRNGALAGVITDGDLRRNMTNLTERSAAEVMNPEPKTITTDTLATEALVRLTRDKITTLFITDADTGIPTGLLHIHDCLRAGLD